jgi:hypothetical protein
MRQEPQNQESFVRRQRHAWGYEDRRQRPNVDVPRRQRQAGLTKPANIPDPNGMEWLGAWASTLGPAKHSLGVRGREISLAR